MRKAFAHSMKLPLRRAGVVLWTEGNTFAYVRTVAHPTYPGMDFVLLHRMNRIPPQSETA